MGTNLPNILLRVGVAFAFIYPPIAALSEPYSWLGYMPGFVRDAGAMVGVGELALLHIFGVVEIVLALWLLSGWRIFYPALAACALLLAIVIVNPSEFPVLFRDLSIAAGAAALALSVKLV